MTQPGLRALALAGGLTLAATPSFAACTLQADDFAQSLPPGINTYATGIADNGEIWGNVSGADWTWPAPFVSQGDRLVDLRSLVGDPSATALALSTVSASGATLVGFSVYGTSPRSGLPLRRLWRYQDGKLSFLQSAPSDQTLDVNWTDDQRRLRGGVAKSTPSGQTVGSGLAELQGARPAVFGWSDDVDTYNAPRRYNASGDFVAAERLIGTPYRSLFWHRAANGSWQGQVVTGPGWPLTGGLSDNGLVPTSSIGRVGSGDAYLSQVLDTRSGQTTALPALAGFDSTIVASISPSGRWITGRAFQFSGGKPSQAVRWQRGGKGWVVGALPHLNGIYDNEGIAVNSRGDVLYRMSVQVGPDADDVQFAFYRDGTAQPLDGVVPGSVVDSTPAMNEQGQVAATLTDSTTLAAHAVRLDCR